MQSFFQLRYEEFSSNWWKLAGKIVRRQVRNKWDRIAETMKKEEELAKERHKASFSAKINLFYRLSWY